MPLNPFASSKLALCRSPNWKESHTCGSSRALSTCSNAEGSRAPVTGAASTAASLRFACAASDSCLLAAWIGSVGAVAAAVSAGTWSVPQAASVFGGGAATCGGGAGEGAAGQGGAGGPAAAVGGGSPPPFASLLAAVGEAAVAAAATDSCPGLPPCSRPAATGTSAASRVSASAPSSFSAAAAWWWPVAACRASAWGCAVARCWSDTAGGGVLAGLLKAS
mmetsp:Transcript_17711/g.53260  ORF Transcript_17711/g.53260 Transcript_17711/m.53260 type:complete len:221 (-) Transcript_17711:330-992(-)